MSARALAVLLALATVVVPASADLVGPEDGLRCGDPTTPAPVTVPPLPFGGDPPEPPASAALRQHLVLPIPNVPASPPTPGTAVAPAVWPLAAAADAQETQWRRTVDLQNTDRPTEIVDDGTGLVAGGQTLGEEDWDAFLLKVDYAGNEVYRVRFDEPGDAISSALAVAPDGATLVAGSLSEYPRAVLWAAKVSPGGEVLWRVDVPVGELDVWTFPEVGVAPDGSAVLAATVREQGQLADAVVKLDAGGAVLWDERTPTGRYALLRAAAASPDGGAVVVGRELTRGHIGTYMRPYVHRYAPDGTLADAASVPLGDAWPLDVAVAPDGAVVFSATLECRLAVFLLQYWRAIVVRLTPDLDLAWHTTLVVGDETRAGGLDLGPDGSVALAGCASLPHALVRNDFTPGDATDGFVARLAPDGALRSVRLVQEVPFGQTLGYWGIMPGGGRGSCAFDVVLAEGGTSAATVSMVSRPTLFGYDLMFAKGPAESSLGSLAAPADGAANEALDEFHDLQVPWALPT